LLEGRKAYCFGEGLKEAIFHLGRFGSTISGMDVVIMEDAIIVSVVTTPINETKLHIVRIINPSN
jgi:hypothetical protein